MSPAHVEDDYGLSFQSHNASGNTTIVLLHACYSSPAEFEHVIPHIPASYHVLVPALPGHSQSAKVKPFSLKLAADCLAGLIKSDAKNGKAHLVGVSLGGFVALDTIRRHPELVESVFTTGASPFTPWQVFMAQYPSLMSWGLYLVIQSGIYRAVAATTKLYPHKPLVAEMLRNNTYELSRDAYRDMRLWQAQEVKYVAEKDTRVLVCAGGVGDDRKATKEFADTLRELGSGDGRETKSAVVRDAIHGWNLQFPRLFARGVIAWIEREPLPEEFEAL